MIADGYDSGANQYELYASSDAGTTWALQSSGYFYLGSIAWPMPAELIGSGSGTAGSGILISADAGATWTMAQSPANGYMSWKQVVASSDGSQIYAVGSAGLAVSRDSGATWSVNQSDQWTQIATSADGSAAVASGTGLPVSVTINSAQDWTQLNSGGQYFSAFVVSSDDQKIFGAVNGGPIDTLDAITTSGAAGFVAGNQYQSATLQYFGNGVFSLIDNEGQLTVQ